MMTCSRSWAWAVHIPTLTTNPFNLLDKSYGFNMSASNSERLRSCMQPTRQGQDETIVKAVSCSAVRLAVRVFSTSLYMTHLIMWMPWRGSRVDQFNQETMADLSDHPWLTSTIPVTCESGNNTSIHTGSVLHRNFVMDAQFCTPCLRKCSVTWRDTSH